MQATPLWVFGYGSLIWHPGFPVAEQQIARLHGWHRSFCMLSIHHRGTIDAPGLVLALDALLRAIAKDGGPQEFDLAAEPEDEKSSPTEKPPVPPPPPTDCAMMASAPMPTVEIVPEPCTSTLPPLPPVPPPPPPTCEVESPLMLMPAPTAKPPVPPPPPTDCA